MTLVLDTTIGGSTANSYCTQQEADDWLAASVYATQWGALQSADKTALLIRAARIVDISANFPGVRISAAQAMQWPRGGVRAPYGYYVGTFYGYYKVDEIPVVLKRAQAELAGWLCTRTDDPFGLNPVGNLESVGAGPVSLKFRDVGGPGPQFFADVVEPILESGYAAFSGTRLVR
jgi:hypothetical protein